jgi:phosphohistidine phosphatase SixA
MRHAKAAAEEPGETDFDRVLTAEGIRMAQETAATLKGCGFQIDRVSSRLLLREHFKRRTLLLKKCS